MRHEQLKHSDDFNIVEIATNEGPASEAVAYLDVARECSAEKAVPDLPVAIGPMIGAAYLLIVAVLAITIANAGQAAFVIVIDLVFLAAFLAVPAIFLKMERDPARRPSLSRFWSQGMQTYTGHVSGGGAMAQIFVVPLLLGFGVLAIGIIAMLS